MSLVNVLVNDRVLVWKICYTSRKVSFRVSFCRIINNEYQNLFSYKLFKNQQETQAEKELRMFVFLQILRDREKLELKRQFYF